MRIYGFGRYALSSCVAGAMLAGCGVLRPPFDVSQGDKAGDDMQPPIGAPFATIERRDSLRYHKTFYYTGSKQSFKVPAGVTALTVDARGAGPARTYCTDRAYNTARGGRVFAVIPVTPHEELSVYVGGQGGRYEGGFNGGGAGGSGGAGDGGGGASDVRVNPGKLHERILVAGGGGAQGGDGDSNKDVQYGCGGWGGGTAGGNGYAGGYSGSNSGGGGTGGTRNMGGFGGPGGIGSGSNCLQHGVPGSSGKLGVAGTGGSLPSSTGYAFGGSGGGGGGGYYGGGGGGSSCLAAGSSIVSGGGGGGGSGYAEPSAARVQMWRNWKRATGNGLVVFSWQ